MCALLCRNDDRNGLPEPPIKRSDDACSRVGGGGGDGDMVVAEVMLWRKSGGCGGGDDVDLAMALLLMRLSDEVAEVSHAWNLNMAPMASIRSLMQRITKLKVLFIIFIAPENYYLQIA